ncbi:GHKL domain-containing protein [Pseudoflavonifractor capillosus]|uniref:ATP-binding protein n=1 Tax=Pseudoflavonifractor capillosus TaxID=106588 RepID=UPI00195A32FC|nr:ATP-binding protein [Pseudoflavonifractor capillosus]MBM6897682.1 GHKL domain-containing protein [Pseudoflavonifractor capillosus]
MYYLVEVFCVASEIWMLHTFLSVFFQSKKHTYGVSIAIYFIFGVILSILSLIDGTIYIRLVFTLLSCQLISTLLFLSRPLHGFSASISFCAIFALTDIISALILQMFGIQVEFIMEDNIYRSLYIIICHILMFGLVILICLINRNTIQEFSIKIILPSIPCWIISMILCVLLTWQCFVMHYALHPMFVFVLLGLLYTNIVVIYYTKRINMQAQERKTWEIAEHHYSMQQKYYEQLCIQQEETRSLWHDIQKYLRAAQIEDSNEPLKQVQERLDGIACVVDVNNQIVNVILNEYLHVAKKEGIQIEFNIDIPHTLFVTAADLYILIGNTMDNALEACAELSPGHRWISLTLKLHNNVLLYALKNPYAEEHIQRVRGKYHGYGLKNVSRCVEKYTGMLSIESNNGIFQFTAHLNDI